MKSNDPKFSARLGGLALVLIGLFFPGTQAMAQRNRLTQLIQPDRRVVLTGHLHPKAIPANDQGPVNPSMILPAVSLVLKPSADQQTNLDILLREQQDPTSPNYHHWLTPEDFADRFGVSDSDVSKLTAWLQQQNLTVVSVARARNSITVSGTAANVGKAFGTEFHNYLDRGKTRFANATEPSIPAPLDLVVKGIHGLNNFRMSPRNVVLQPNYTSNSGNHYIAPDDFATIYNVKPLYGAGIDGSGQKIVVVGQTQVNPADLQLFQSYFSLTGPSPLMTLVPKLGDPGVVSDDLSEADLDLEIAGAVARNASINFVYSPDVTDAVQYAVDQNLAPVISMSYGLCEAETFLSDALMMQSWAQQANAQGITWLAASGDSGGADCVNGSSLGGGLAVDAPSSIPEVTGVGGTEFSDAGGAFWNTSNDANRASARSYIPEVTWNDSVQDGSPSASGGGASVFFLKPSWQTGAGVPSDGARDVPDVSLAASADHDGFLIYSGGKLQIYGGTSVAAPAFAGILALANQQLTLHGGGAGLGNLNPKLYSLAQTTPAVFHDVTSGSNIVTITCPTRSRNCLGGSFGYSAGPGYDQTTGLGSVDANAFVAAVSGQGISARSVPALVLSSDSPSIVSSSSVTITAVLTGSNGNSPVGNVTFYYAGAALGAGSLNGSGGTSTATLVVNGSQLPLGADLITAQYNGDSTYANATASITITLVVPNSGPPAIGGISNGASYRQSYAPGMVLSIFGSQLSPVTWIAPSVPLATHIAGVTVTVNGVQAPLYYISPTQLNVQIPYEVGSGITATLTIQNNGQTTSTSLPLTAAAPGIFADATGALVPAKSASISQIISLYMTGGGAVTPTITTGAAPQAGTAIANLPHPLQNVTVTIAGVNAPLQFVGIPAGLVGVVQINFQVPSGIPLGSQPVLVRVGTATSAPVSLTITQ